MFQPKEVSPVSEGAKQGVAGGRNRELVGSRRSSKERATGNRSHHKGEGRGSAMQESEKESLIIRLRNHATFTRSRTNLRIHTEIDVIA